MSAKKGNKYAVGNDGGRPRKIEKKDLPALGLKMVDWFEKEAETFLERLVSLSDKKRFPHFPFLSRFARKVLGISEDTLTRYSKENKEFCGSYNDCQAIQKETLISAGLSGKTNPAFTIFTAKNITDMRDRTETDITTGGEKIAGINYIVPVENKKNAKNADNFPNV